MNSGSGPEGGFPHPQNISPEGYNFVFGNDFKM